jgi:hypothetical protein
MDYKNRRGAGRVVEMYKEVNRPQKIYNVCFSHFCKTPLV